MGFLGKYAAARWASNSGGGGREGGVLALFFLIFLSVIGVLWGISKILSFIWDFIYGIIHPVIIIAPTVTVPAAVILLGLLFCVLAPYKPKTAIAYIDGAEGTFSHFTRSMWAIAAINALVIVGARGLPQTDGILGNLLLLPLALFMLYGFFELAHTPYRCTKLLLNAPKSKRYVILFLAPILFVIVVGAFGPFGSGESSTTMSTASLGLAAVGILNATYIGGPTTVYLKRNAIREAANERMDSIQQDTQTSTGSTIN